MSVGKKKYGAAPVAPRARKGRGRQRQRLIDACISALHIYGPSRTTVEKVVAIAKMSPGIVRFYFDSKAAMLVASLQFLAAEFEEQVMVPVAKLKATPINALQLLVDLYLDPAIASPRKVSVWYAFWGEASSRQEYYDICGQKDASFAVLVRELIEALITETSQPQLDADGVALGLIGVLEILWQDIAFQTERDIDRPTAKRRCMAYLRSIFPGRFDPAAGTPAGSDPAVYPACFAGWVYGNPRIFGMERESLFEGAWSVVGHESQIPHAGEFFALDIGVERILVVRDATGTLHALRNNCPGSPHALAGHTGRFDGSIECRVHGLKFSLDGHAAGSSRLDLHELELRTVAGLLFVRSPRLTRSHMPEGSGDEFDVNPRRGLMALDSPLEVVVRADWKVVVEQWLESATPDPAPTPQHSCVWRPSVSLAAWSGGHYSNLLACLPSEVWRRRFIPPNQLFETRPDGLAVVQAVPLAPGRCLVRRLDYTALPPDDRARAAQYLARRVGAHARRATLDRAESIQNGRIEYGYQVASGGRIPPGVAWFRDWLVARIPALASHRPPTGS